MALKKKTHDPFRWLDSSPEIRFVSAKLRRAILPYDPMSGVTRSSGGAGPSRLMLNRTRQSTSLLLFTRRQTARVTKTGPPTLALRYVVEQDASTSDCPGRHFELP